MQSIYPSVESKHEDSKSAAVSSLLVARMQGVYRRAVAQYCFRRPFVVKPDAPLISFSFDDFPRSALTVGGSILKSHGVSGTYYAALGLLGRTIETGQMFDADDLYQLVDQGHELGCHTFGHCHAWNTPPLAFEQSVLENQRTLHELIPSASMPTLSYPISVPRAGTKEKVSQYFACSRGGGQKFNAGVADLNYLSAFFIEQCRECPEKIYRIIEQTCQSRGWLIFATHDIGNNHTPWGCSPELFEQIVRFSVSSGARILPVFQAYQALASKF